MGIIVNENQQVCIAQRDAKAHLGGLWEFPGGKVEGAENDYAALCRELKEELGINVVLARPLMEAGHDYPDLHVHLSFWLVEQFTGTARGAEGQPVQWVGVANLSQYHFPEGNQSVIETLRKIYGAS